MLSGEEVELLPVRVEGLVSLDQLSGRISLVLEGLKTLTQHFLLAGEGLCLIVDFLGAGRAGAVIGVISIIRGGVIEGVSFHF